MSEKWSLVIGRFQPLHDGHIAMIKKLLNENKSVLVAVMDTPIDDDNPYSLDERFAMFDKEFNKDPRIMLMEVPPIAEVCYGRNPGFWVRRVVHGAEQTTATAIRTSGQEPAFDYDPEFLAAYRKVAERQHQIMSEQGFWKEGAARPIYEPIALAHSELSEALECARMHNPPDKNIKEMTGVEVQLSDVLGILMDMEIGYGFKIAESLGRKQAFNRTRGFMHGGKEF
jgi:cytidyltransferase-like protein